MVSKIIDERHVNWRSNLETMNIAFISNEYPPNVRAGLGRYAERITKYFLQTKHRLWVFAANPGNTPLKEGEIPLVIYRPITPWVRRILSIQSLKKSRLIDILLICLNLFVYNIGTFFLIKKLHKKVQFDIIAFHDTTSGPIIGLLTTLFLKIPVVFHCHSAETTMTPFAIVKDPFKIIKFAEKLIANHADQIIVLSEEYRDFVIKHGWQPEKINIVFHGFDNEDYLNIEKLPASFIEKQLNQIRVNLNLHKDHKSILFVGRLTTVKGIHTLIKAMKKVIAIRPDAKLIIVGEGKGSGNDQRVENLIKKLQLEHHIYAYYQFLDSQQVMWHNLLADICVFPSLHEPFGLVAVEAMSLGKSVILGPGFSRIFLGNPDKPAAIFLSENNPDELAEKIIDLLNNPENGKQLGNAAKTYVKNTFRWENTVKETIGVYEKAILEHSRKYT